MLKFNFDLAFPVRADVCEQHGEFESKNPIASIWTKCPVCSANVAAKDALLKAEKEAKEKISRWQNKLKMASIPERFLDRTLQNYVVNQFGQEKVLAFSLDFAASFAGEKSGRCAIFGGERGTGKTHLAVGIASEVMTRHQKTAVFITVQRLIRAVRDTWRKSSSQSETEAIALFTSPDLLILDEIGIQAGSENEKQILFDVLNDRYEQRKSTLLLTNLTCDECVAFLGERVFDRMREDGGRFVPFAWDSYRGSVA